MMESIKKVAFISGSSRGLGRAIAKNLAQNGYDIAINYVSREQDAENVKSWILENTNQKAILVKGDISKEDFVKKMIQETEEKLGPITLLVNNAAIAIDTLVEDKTKEDFMRVLEVNLLGTFLLSKYIGGEMYKRKFGKIINISSTNGIDTEYPEGMDYDASKSGVISLTKNFAKAYAPYVQVNTVAPGWINTEMSQTLDEDYKNQEEEKILLGRFADPEEIAKVVTFLSSDDASYINSSIIRVDGGVK